MRRVVERALQAGEHAGHQVAQPVDHPYPISDQIGPVTSQNREVADLIGVGVDDCQVSAQTRGFGDDVSVLGVSGVFPVIETSRF